MSVSLRVNSNFTSANTTQKKLREMMAHSPATLRFQALFGVALDNFVDHIAEVFVGPKAEGLKFTYKPGMRESFVKLVDPMSSMGKITWRTFSAPDGSPMEPDDPQGSADRHWRKLASAVSAGISYREPGLKPSLHIAIGKVLADVHVDREGFLKSIGGRITYDPTKTLNHLTADLLSDHVPVAVTSLTVKDGKGSVTSQATLAPWLEVRLPGTEDPTGKRSSGTEAIGGIRLFGVFSAGGG